MGQKMLCLEKPHLGQALHQKGMFRHTFTVVASRRVQAWGSCSSQCMVGSWPSSSAGIRGGQCIGDTERRGDTWAQGSRAVTIWPPPRECVCRHTHTHSHTHTTSLSIHLLMDTCAASLSIRACMPSRSVMSNSL